MMLITARDKPENTGLVPTTRAHRSCGQAHLMQEWLEHISCLGHCNDTCSPGVVHTIMEIINPTRIHNLLSGDVWASQLPNAVPELSHCSVVLSTSKQTHVSVGQILWYRQGFAVWPHESTCTSSSHISLQEEILS